MCVLDKVENEKYGLEQAVLIITDECALFRSLGEVEISLGQPTLSTVDVYIPVYTYMCL